MSPVALVAFPRRGVPTRRPQQGVSLIELMVALVIAALLGIGLVQIFGGTRTAFNTNTALARAQENSRFALGFINEDLRMVGHLGTRNEQGAQPGAAEEPFANLLFNHMATNSGTDARKPSSAPWVYRLDIPFQAFDYTGSGMGASVTLDASPAVATAASNWSPALPSALWSAFSTNKPLKNSDILVARYLSAEYVTLVNARARGDGMAVSANLPFDGATGKFFWREFDATKGFVVDNGIYAFSNARAVSLFQVSAASTSALIGDEGSAVAGGTLDWSSTLPIGQDGSHTENPADYGSLLPVHRYDVSVFYTALGADGGPSLFRMRLKSDGTLGESEELVPGVESIQAVMGVVAAYPRPADVPTAYMSAGTVESCGFTPPTGSTAADTCWRAVVSARVGLLMRAQQMGGTDETDQTFNVAGTNITPNSSDRHLRYVYETQVSFRNRSRG